MYDENFTALSEGEFVASAAPLIEAYKDAMGRRDTHGAVKLADIREAERALTAHCNAWAITKRRKLFVEEMIQRECYGV